MLVGGTGPCTGGGRQFFTVLSRSLGGREHRQGVSDIEVATEATSMQNTGVYRVR